MTTKPSSDGSKPSTSPPPASVQANSIPSLLKASHLITSAPDEESLASAFARIMASFDVDFYTLSSFHDQPERYLKTIAALAKQGEAPIRPGDTFLMRPDSLIGSIPPGASLIVEDYTASRPTGDTEAMRLFAESIGARAFSIFVLAERGETAGFLAIFYKKPHPRSEEEEQVFSLLAQLTAVALVNMASRTQLAKKVKQLDELYRIGETINQLTDEDTLFQTTATLLASEIHYLNCWIGLVDEEAGVLREVGHAGAGVDPTKPLAFPLHDQSILTIAALHGGQPVGHSRVQEHARAEGWGDIARDAKLKSGVYVPLRAGGDVFGLMTVASPDPYTSDEVSLLGAFGNQLASAVVRLRMNKERSRQVAELEAAYAAQARLLETVRALSTPVIPVHDGVLVLPLVGTVDSSRSALLMESLLNAVQKERASVVILDITGVATVDTGVANHVLRSARAAALLGAQCVLVGVSPAVAQTMVQLGVDLGDLVTRRDLQSGISYALGVLGRALR